MSVFQLLDFVSADNLSQSLCVADAHDADVVVEAEGLDQCEVDLQRDVALKLLIRGQDAEGHAVWVSVDKRTKIQRSDLHHPDTGSDIKCKKKPRYILSA